MPLVEAVKKAFLAARPDHVHTRSQCANDGVDWDGNLTTAEGLATGAISGMSIGGRGYLERAWHVYCLLTAIF